MFLVATALDILSCLIIVVNKGSMTKKLHNNQTSSQNPQAEGHDMILSESVKKSMPCPPPPEQARVKRYSFRYKNKVLEMRGIAIERKIDYDLICGYKNRLYVIRLFCLD